MQQKKKAIVYPFYCRIISYIEYNQLYKQHFEDMQRMNQQWFNFFWRPFMAEQQQQEEQ
jgi:hypothetical protein